MSENKKYTQLTEQELALYKEEMETHKNISEELFEEIFLEKYDCKFPWYEPGYKSPCLWGLESPEVEDYNDNTYQKLNHKTWLLNKDEQLAFTIELEEKNIPKERQEQYASGFPYVSAVVIPVEDMYGNNTDYYGFYPYSGKLLERFTDNYKKQHLKEELIRRHKIHFKETKHIENYDIKLNEEEMNMLKKLNEGRYDLLRKQEEEIQAIKEKYKTKIENYINLAINDL